MNPIKNNLTNLDLNPGQRVCLVPDLVFFCMAWDFLLVSGSLLMIHVMVMEVHFYHKSIFVDRVPDSANAMNFLKGVYGMYVLTVRKTVVLS